MLVSSYSNGFGQSQVPTLRQLVYANTARSGLGGLGIVSDFDAFLDGGRSATFKSADGVVYCNKDNANRPQCWLNKVGEAGKAPIRAMQQAIDRLTNLATQQLAGRELRGPVPKADGTTPIESFKIDNITDPIKRRAGYDGIVGPDTRGAGVYAITIAGMLKKTPNTATSIVFTHPTREDIWAAYSQETANYLNDVADNFATLMRAYEARDYVPAQTPLVADTIPYVVPKAAEKTKIGPIVVGAAAMLGATTIGALAAGKKKPGFMYEPSPAFGRNRRGGKLRPRGW